MIGRRARQRVRAGGPTSTHRAALPLTEYQALVRYVKAREGHRCFRCRQHRPLDPHHVVKRSQGGADDPSNLVALCRPCHAQTDWSMDRGRLIIELLGAERFWYWVSGSAETGEGGRTPL